MGCFNICQIGLFVWILLPLNQRHAPIEYAKQKGKKIATKKSGGMASVELYVALPHTWICTGSAW